MSYINFKISLSHQSLKELEKIPKKDRSAIITKIESLTRKDHNLDIKKLQGYSDLYRIRHGNYRVYSKLSLKTKLYLLVLLPIVKKCMNSYLK